MDGGGREGTVAPGIRFYPTEEELVSFYLKNKINGSRTQDMDRVIPQLDVYDFNPSDLPLEYAGELGHGEDKQWFFYIPRQEKEANGGRACRLTNLGYWKSSGSPSVVYSSSNQRIGMKRTMVFYYGRAPAVAARFKPVQSLYNKMLKGIRPKATRNYNTKFKSNSANKSQC
ncbi:hypothetical protein L6452_37375 [Arctium lappa]|uniref:Uncharacterized protein n=1 Tax=Arctium lappa TaxID=4217 RepID=A0ACB8Y3Y4_ARCLA|nr:hypothetical protein L6452_37375 [Arctium lappa]